MHVIVKVYCVHEDLGKNVLCKLEKEQDPLGIEYKCPACGRKIFLENSIVP